jgi:DNA modification methylase/ParB-like chromosome segregation protein Spo0J
MRVHSIPFEEISVLEDRQRREFAPEALVELASSITQNGLIHPVVVRKQDNETILVAGERRIRAMQYIWNFGETVRCGDHNFPEMHVPCLFLGEIDPIDAYEIELEENIRRTDLTWQERAIATKRLFDLRNQKAEKIGAPPPTIQEFAKQVDGQKDIDLSARNVRRDVILAENLANPVVAKAKTPNEAMKALKREEEAKKNVELAKTVGATLTRDSHVLLQGDCIQLLAGLPELSFDVILSDPPYGIDAQDFNDSGGLAGGGGDGGHFYDDSYETWKKLMDGLFTQLDRVAKVQAHLYLFCDIDRFHELRGLALLNGWKPFRTPLIWHNPTANRAPWPQQGPQRKWQAILYAIKGEKPTQALYPDIIVFPSDSNLGHPAQKPVSLYLDLLRRSVRPGDCVLDPFCGSGPIFPAAHQMKCRATGIEQDLAAFGIATKRLEELK